VSSDGLALLVLAISLLIALLGLWDLIIGYARRAALRDRTLERPPPSRTRTLVNRLNAWLERRPAGHRLAVALMGAGVRLTVLQFASLALLAGIAGYLAASLVFSRPIAIIAGLLAVRGCWWWLARKREQRRNLFVAQLPELARLLSNGTSAGLSVVASLRLAVAELEDPARRELEIALEEIRIGAPFDVALAHLGERMPSRELGVLVNTLVIQQRSGGDLVRALSDMADTLDQRKDTIREVRTVMAGAVSTAYIVAGLGVASVFVLDLIKPGSLDELTTSGAGIAVLIISSILYAAGFTLVRQVTRIET
jgi:tight adherence protein B